MQNDLLWRQLSRGEITACLVSFMEETSEGKDEFNPYTTLKPVYGEETEKKLYEVWIQEETIRKTLKWVDVTEPAGGVTNEELFVCYLATLKDVFFGDVMTLVKFITDRDWSTPFWKSKVMTSIEDVMSIIKQKLENDHDLKWRQLRWFISWNMAWETKLLLLPVDGMHRCTVASSVLNGVPQPGADRVISGMVNEF